MKITVSYDLGGNLVAPSDIKISANIETTVGNSPLVPDITEVMAGGLAPILQHLHMSEGWLEQTKNHIIYGGRLLKKLKYPFRYSIPDHAIINDLHKEVKYSVKDYLEGKVPGLSGADEG